MTIIDLSKSNYKAPGHQAAGRLGNSTKSAPPSAHDKNEIRLSNRQDRYKLQDVAKSALGRKSRIYGCSRFFGKDQGGKTRDSISVVKNINGHAHYSGLSVCGSIWACPVCSFRISEVRRKEVLQALRLHREAGGVALLVTFTFAHTYLDGLKDQMKAFSKALSRMKGRKAYKKIRDRISQTGSIRALEVNHGQNGWHPHVHELWFLDEELSSSEINELENSLYTLWAHQAVKAGLGRPSRRHGVDVSYRASDGSDSVGSYVTKWGNELTQTHYKKGRHGGRTPWDILRDIQKKWTPKDYALFREYAEAMHGRAALYWSKGLKARFEIEQKDDQTIAESVPDEIVEHAEITLLEWKAVVLLNRRVMLLEIYEKSGLSGLQSFLIATSLEYSERVISRRREKRELTKRIYDSTMERYGHMLY